MTDKTAEAIKALLISDEIITTPSAIAPIIGCKPITLNDLAQQGKLEIPHVLLGRNLRIYRVPFLRLIGYDVRPPFEKNEPAQ